MADRAGLEPYDRYDENDDEGRRTRVAMRVVADHVRTLAVAIADGALPGNTGRGYVLRRILRRAVRYGYQALGLREPFLAALLPALAQEMGDAFPELVASIDTASRVITAEEESFLSKVEGGESIMELTFNAGLLHKAVPGMFWHLEKLERRGEPDQHR